ncbi:hypothetical protein DID88_005962 [Monilinia fructigena]|uniref:Short-chain dehydrogenase/reductase ABA4 n=1 Tax=Monilinia fructigena TaxID=38457 RepID=A0A395J1B9_9HELO|nr:hypothetical protein DID88_005962 [Monilinia fructigena]
MSELRYDGQVVVVTGAGGGLGKAYALFFGTRGASVVVNDLGGSLKGEGNSTKAADVVVDEIKAAGGKAVANYDSVTEGEKIIETAIKNYGRIDILLNNAGILRDISFKNMQDKDWDLIIDVHVKGSYKCVKAAWPHFRKQKYGKVINTASAAGLFGSFGQTNYSAAKLALVGFTETLAKEGAKYNIHANVIAPIAASRITQTVMPPEILEKPETRLVGGGHVAKLRWERSSGLLLKADDSYTPGAILKKWDQVSNFKEAEHPSGPADFMGLLERSMKMGPNEQGETLDFKGKVALVTGGGAGIGRCYCLAFAKIWCLSRSVGVKASAEDGDAVVKAAIDAYGRIDIIINNAGILRDKAFTNMDDKMWDQVMAVHLRGTYKVTKAAWPYFLKQKYGRVVNTTSSSGIYGNFGQANYSAAKCGILGFSRALAREGAKYNIYVNTIAPNAGTAMTRTIMPEEVVQAFKPDYIAPLVVVLCSDKVPKPPTGGLFEVGSGWVGRTRWQRSGGYGFPVDVKLTPEEVLKNWEKIINFDDGRSDNPEDSQDGLKSIMANMQNKKGSASKKAEKKVEVNQEILDKISAAKKAEASGSEFTFEERDVMLYNLSVGAKKSELSLVFEGDENFQPLPTFVDKGGAAIVKIGTTTIEKETGKKVFYNEQTAFLRGSGGFGGERKGEDRGNSTRANTIPESNPDVVVEEETTEEQAVLYRLSGDYNPLHVDPKFAAVGGFKAPILHGLCFMGIAGKAVYQEFGPYKNIKARFAGTVIPGQTLVTEMWKEGEIEWFFRRRLKRQENCVLGWRSGVIGGEGEVVDGMRLYGRERNGVQVYGLGFGLKLEIAIMKLNGLNYITSY